MGSHQGSEKVVKTEAFDLHNNPKSRGERILDPSLTSLEHPQAILMSCDTSRQEPPSTQIIFKVSIDIYISGV
jgi:hypothetical protein